MMRIKNINIFLLFSFLILSHAEEVKKDKDQEETLFRYRKYDLPDEEDESKVSTCNCYCSRAEPTTHKKWKSKIMSIEAKTTDSAGCRSCFFSFKIIGIQEGQMIRMVRIIVQNLSFKNINSGHGLLRD